MRYLFWAVGYGLIIGVVMTVMFVHEHMGSTTEGLEWFVMMTVNGSFFFGVPFALLTVREG